MVAAVSAGDNLKDDVSGRRSVLYIDDKATGAQMKVLCLRKVTLQ